MAVFYTGPRPVTKGRNYKDSVHHWKGTEGVYSNYSLMNTSHVLDGAPNRHVELGDDSRLSRPTLLEYIYSGGHHIAPIDDVGGGERIDGMRYRPLEYRGAGNNRVFGEDYGHSQEERTDYARYTNYIFDGLDVAEPLTDPGHPVRYNATWGGAFNPWVHKGVNESPLHDSGQALPEGYDYLYGKNKINEWRGVPSARAL